MACGNELEARRRLQNWGNPLILNSRRATNDATRSATCPNVLEEGISKRNSIRPRRNNYMKKLAILIFSGEKLYATVIQISPFAFSKIIVANTFFKVFAVAC